MALLIDIVVPGDTRVDEKEQEKVDKYQDLARKTKRLWKVEAHCHWRFEKDTKRSGEEPENIGNNNKS